jgi:hypothetical protein
MRSPARRRRKEVQIDLTTDEILHADLIRIAMTRPSGSWSPWRSRESLRRQTEGGFVDFMTREVEVEPAGHPSG